MNPAGADVLSVAPLHMLLRDTDYLWKLTYHEEAGVILWSETLHSGQDPQRYAALGDKSFGTLWTTLQSVSHFVSWFHSLVRPSFYTVIRGQERAEPCEGGCVPSTR